MRTIGLKPGDRVLVIEGRQDGDALRNGLVLAMHMEEALRGPQGEMAIDVVIAGHEGGRSVSFEPVTLTHVRHFSHPDWQAGAVAFAYEALPPQSGVCLYCGCTEMRPCYDGNGHPCSWLTDDRTVCSAFSCLERFSEDVQPMDFVVNVRRA